MNQQRHNLLVAVALATALLVPSAALGEVGQFAGSGGRTIKFRYELKPEWSPEEPRGVHVYFHGNNTGTQDDMLRFFFFHRDLAWKLNLIPVSLASPEAIPPSELRWQYESTSKRYTGYGTRLWYSSRDGRLVHDLLQSEFGQRFRVDFDRVYLHGGSAGTCFLNHFVPKYGESYGGGLLAHCGCFGDRSHVNFLQSSQGLWSPSEEFRRKFRVFVSATKEDFLYWDSIAAYGYYKHTVGLDAFGDFGASGGHCAPTEVSDEGAMEWLINGSGLQQEPPVPHFRRVSVMDGLVGITVDDDGALWIARQHEATASVMILRSVDRGEQLEAVARLDLDVHDLDATGNALVVTASEGGVLSRYRSSNMGKTFHKLDQDGGVRLTNTVADIHGNLYAIIPRQGVHVSQDHGESWTSLGPDSQLEELIFGNPDRLHADAQSGFLFLEDYWSNQIRWLGATAGYDWNLVRPFRAGHEWGVYSLAWDGVRFFGLSRGPGFDDGALFTSNDRGSTWDEEPMPDDRAVSWRSRASAIGNGEILVVGGTARGYLRDPGGEWTIIPGAYFIGHWPQATISTHLGFDNDGHRLAVDRHRGDVYLTGGAGIFRLDGQFRASGAVAPLPDGDGDGIPDKLDAFPSDGYEYLDSDGDGIANGVDDDDDGDGVSDWHDAVPLDRFDAVDTDGDGVGDTSDPDDDGDGVWDAIDAFPLDASAQADWDGDGIANSIDEDDDGDGVRDSEDAFPKYPHEWLDTDGDGIGDNIDVDDDNDGLPDAQDPWPKSGEPRPHLVPVTRLPGNLRWEVHSRWVFRKRAQLHTERPLTYAYPEGAGRSQDYGQITLGNGARPDVQFMIDYFDGVGLLYVDRNNNGDLTDDGPPALRANGECCIFELVQIEVTYATGVTVPYTISAHLPTVHQGGAWIGNVEVSGRQFLALTVDRDIDGLFTGTEDYVCVDADGDLELDCANIDSPERFAHGDVAILAGRRLRVMVAESGHRIEFADAVEAYHIPLLPAASHPTRQGFVRIVNRGESSGTVGIAVFDDMGESYGSLSLAIDGLQTVHFNSDDLESGNPDKGLSVGVGSGSGRWRLEVTSEMDIEVLGYIRTEDGFLTGMHDFVALREDYHAVPIFNPASNGRQVSWLRLINSGTQDALVTIEGIDDKGTLSQSVEVAVSAGASRDISAEGLESGGAGGLVGAIGDGDGKWRLRVRSDHPIRVMNLLESPTGHLTNLSTTRPPDAGTHHVPLFPAASHPTQQGFVRVINLESRSGTLEIAAFDDSGTLHGPVSLSIGGRETIHFNSDDLETGNSSKGFTGGVGVGTGHWRLELRGDLDAEVLGYIRTADGFVTSMHDRAALRGGWYRLPIFNPGSNDRQVSSLRLVNPGTEDATAWIEATDDRGVARPVLQVAVPAGGSRELSAALLETGGADGLVGSLGDGHGKWRLNIRSEVPVLAMSVLESPSGHLTNLSTSPGTLDGR